MLSAGCGSGIATRAPVTTEIPPAPDYLTPVAVAKPKAGEFCEAAIDRTRGGLKVANIKIGRARTDWEAMRETLRKPPSPEG